MDAALPRCEARVSAELVRLLSGIAGQPDPAPSVPAATQPAVVRRPKRHRMTAIRLRVDGARPMAFNGALICSDDDVVSCLDVEGQAAQITTQLQLYSAEDGRIVAYAAAIPDPGLPARPVHKVAYVANSDDVDALLQSAAPAMCFDVAPPEQRAGVSDRLPTAPDAPNGFRLSPRTPRT
ncbi:MAG: hypothetical protein AAGF88_09155 [Pseudomonadota bacterium]